MNDDILNLGTRPVLEVVVFSYGFGITCEAVNLKKIASEKCFDEEWIFICSSVHSKISTGDKSEFICLC